MRHSAEWQSGCRAMRGRRLAQHGPAAKPRRRSGELASADGFRTRPAIMGKNIYVGNLPYDTTRDDLVELFQTYGTVTSGQVIIYKFSGRSWGFGFVEMANDVEAQAAI